MQIIHDPSIFFLRDIFQRLSFRTNVPHNTIIRGKKQSGRTVKRGTFCSHFHINATFCLPVAHFNFPSVVRLMKRISRAGSILRTCADRSLIFSLRWEINHSYLIRFAVPTFLFLSPSSLPLSLSLFPPPIRDHRLLFVSTVVLMNSRTHYLYMLMNKKYY